MMSHWLDEYEKEDVVKEDVFERKLAREGACEQDVWIKPILNGARVISPYHCGTCDACLDRKSIEIRDKIMLHDAKDSINLFVARPDVVNKMIKVIRSADYARFPCANGYDYLFSIDGVGKHFLNSDVDYTILTRRREGTRKTGRLILSKDKNEIENAMEVENIRASGRTVAVVTLVNVIEEIKEMHFWNKEITDPQTLAIYCNVASMKITRRLEEEDAFVFGSFIKVEYELPTIFDIKYTVKGFVEDEPF